MSITIRAALAQDVGALQAIERAAARLFDGLSLVPDAAGVADEAQHEAARQAGLAFVAEAQEERAGFVIGWRHEDEAYLAELSVAPSHARRGIGARLLEHFSTAAAEGGAASIVLSTFRDPPWNAPFYARHGFQEAPRDTYRDWMRAYEANQVAAGLDVTKRLFMRRALR